MNFTDIFGRWIGTDRESSHLIWLATVTNHEDCHLKCRNESSNSKTIGGQSELSLCFSVIT